MKKRIPIKSKNITLNGVDYEIESVAGKGGSCIVYNAYYKNSFGIPQPVRIKELYPYKLDGERLENDELCFESEDEFEEHRNRFFRAAEMQRSIRNTTNIVNSSANIHDVFQDNGTAYHILEYYDGVEFNSGNIGSLEKYISALIQVAETLKIYHEKGYLHLDIKPDNLYYLPCGDDFQKDGKVILFDFDSVIEKSNIFNSVISYSAEYAAPELRNGDIESISEKSDFYSIGCMLFEIVMGRRPNSLDCDIFAEWDFDRKSGVLKDVGDRFFELVEDFFHCTLSSWTYDRYNNDDELIEALYELHEASKIKKTALLSNVHSSDGSYFVGRKTELAQIYEKLGNMNHVFLQGTGGIGKSLLAVNYALQHTDEYNHIVFARYSESFVKLLNSDFEIPVVNFEKSDSLSDEEYAERKFEAFRRICEEEKVLLILDNCDFDDNSILEEWLDLPCHIIITTRMNLSESENDSITLTGLKEADELFNHYCRREFSSDEKKYLHDIFRYIEYHTMTIELLSKLMRDSEISMQYVYEKFTEINTVLLPENPLKNVKDSSYGNKSVNQYLDVLFKISDFSEEEEKILESLALVIDRTFSYKLFEKLFDFDNNILKKLIYKGWLSEDRNMNLIIIHPLILDRILLHMDFDAEKTEPVIKRFTDIIKYDEKYRDRVFLDICIRAEQRITGQSEPLAYLQYLLAMFTDSMDYCNKSYSYYRTTEKQEEMEKKLELIFRISELKDEIKDSFEYSVELLEVIYDLLCKPENFKDDYILCIKIGDDFNDIMYSACFETHYRNEDYWLSDAVEFKFQEEYYRYALENEECREKAKERLMNFYSDILHYSRAKQHEFEDESYDVSEIFSEPVNSENVFGKEMLLEDLLFDELNEQFAVLGNQLAKYYLEFYGHDYYYPDLSNVIKALELSEQYDLLKDLYDKRLSSYERYDYIVIDYAELLYKLGEYQQAYTLLKEQQIISEEESQDDQYKWAYNYKKLLQLYLMLIILSDDIEETKDIINKCCVIINNINQEFYYNKYIIEAVKRCIALEMPEEASCILYLFTICNFGLDDKEQNPEYIELRKQIPTENKLYLYYHDRFIINETDCSDEEKYRLYCEMAECAGEAFGEDDIKRHRALKNAADFADENEKADIASLIDYELLTKANTYEDSFAYESWTECAENYENAGNTAKANEIRERLDAKIEYAKENNPQEYFEMLSEIQKYYKYRNKELRLKYILEQYELIESQKVEKDFSEKYYLCCETADCYKDLCDHENEVIWLKKALKFAEQTEDIDYDEILEKLSELDSENSGYYLKKLTQIQQNRFI